MSERASERVGASANDTRLDVRRERLPRAQRQRVAVLVGRGDGCRQREVRECLAELLRAMRCVRVQA